MSPPLWLSDNFWESRGDVIPLCITSPCWLGSWTAGVLPAPSGIAEHPPLWDPLQPTASHFKTPSVSGGHLSSPHLLPMSWKQRGCSIGVVVGLNCLACDSLPSQGLSTRTAAGEEPGTGNVSPPLVQLRSSPMGLGVRSSTRHSWRGVRAVPAGWPCRSSCGGCQVFGSRVRQARRCGSSLLCRLGWR